MATTLSRQIGNQTLTFGTGKLARQAHGSCTVQYGETQILATCTTAKPREGIDFFPLTIDVEERMYAAGKIPGGFFRREGRPSETAILTARLTDRPMRPSFKDGYRDEVQVVITVLSADMANPYDIPGMNGASLATMISGIPFEGPVGSVRLGLIGGEWQINPTFLDVEEATFDIVVAGRRNDAGEIDILMIEGEAPDNTWQLLGGSEGAVAPTEEVVAQGLEAAKRAIAELIDFQLEFLSKLDVKPKPFEPRPLYEPDTWSIVEAYAKERLETAIVTDKQERETALSEIKDLLKGHLLETWGQEVYATREAEISPAWKDLQKKVMRARVIEHGVRLDGRGPKDIRPLSAEIGLIPRAHGSALFNRGDTQALNVTTLGMLRMTQMIDTLDPEDSKRYMHHYNFPPFSTGEVGRIGSPRRREIGHGALAERALVPVIPPEEEFPYALRLVSDILASNGSTSMASVCASTLSLMDAGVPLKAPVAGIAMGMIAENGTFVTLTDILGAEDMLGDMDFKVAGTKDIVTAIQLDMKVTGLPGNVLAGALDQAKEARLKILDVMQAAIPVPRTEVNPKAPRILTLKIPVDKIGEVIGPKGKKINEIVAMTGADIDIQDDGTVFVGARDGAGADEAARIIDEIANPRPINIGEHFTGTVVNTTTFGAFVNLVPGRDGLIHISKLGRGKRLASVEEAVKVGDTVEVEVVDIDDRGKISLKPVGEEWAIPEGMEVEDDRPPRRDRGDRDRGGRGGRDGGRDRDRRPRDRDRAPREDRAVRENTP
ncbi:MAG: polyribonucleotide nucleotidyltransferase, partial [Actinomycetota bacterium]